MEYESKLKRFINQQIEMINDYTKALLENYDNDNQNVKLEIEILKAKRELLNSIIKICEQRGRF